MNTTWGKQQQSHAKRNGRPDERLNLDLHNARLLADDVLDERAEPLDGALCAGHGLLDLLALGGALLERGAEPLAEVPAGEAEDLARLARDAVGVRGGERSGLLRVGRRRGERGFELAADVAGEGTGEVVDEVRGESDRCGNYSVNEKSGALEGKPTD